MTIATGVAKKLAYCVESVFGTPPGAGSAQYLRRVQSTLGLGRQAYQSQEVRTDYQIADYRMGTRTVQGAINGELSGLTYKDFMAAALHGTWAATTAATGLSLTIAAGTPATVTRSGSWISDGFKIGDVVRFSVGTLNAANLNHNFRIVALTATVMSILDSGSSVATVVAEGPIASCTATVVGKKVMVPTTGHVDPSYTIEHYFSDLDVSELFTGCKIDGMSLNLPATGMAGVSFNLKGQDMQGLAAAAAPYYTSPTANTTSGILAAVNGRLAVAGSDIATVTGLQIQVASQHTGDPVVGSNTIPALLPSRVVVSGSFSAYFDGVVLRDDFINETEIALNLVMESGGATPKDFLMINLPRIKLGSASKNDVESGLIQQFNFQALYPTTGGAGTAYDQSTIVIQDSLA